MVHLYYTGDECSRKLAKIAVIIMWVLLNNEIRTGDWK